MTQYPYIDSAFKQIKNASSKFLKKDEPFTPDTLSWAILALEAGKLNDKELLSELRKQLTLMQLENGSVVLSKEYPHICWPTPIALLAWVNDPDFNNNSQRAKEFLLNTSGEHWVKKPGSPVRHDPSIKGWSWIAGTHSWVQPTSMSMLALKATGLTSHSRITEASDMLINRQLPSGGWNYGNTFVFNTELRPTPDGTGHALCALNGLVKKTDIEISLKYLRNIITKIRTPISLAWSLLALSAWSERPPNVNELISESLKLQKRLGPYSISLLSQLIISCYGKNGLLKLFEKGRTN